MNTVIALNYDNDVGYQMHHPLGVRTASIVGETNSYHRWRCREFSFSIHYSLFALLQFTCFVLLFVQTDEYRYPYAVALTKGSDRFFCGGSLIARDVVLTAGVSIFFANDH